LYRASFFLSFYNSYDSTRAHLVLTKLGIVHFLCLGGLWGQVRIGRALPWARKVELCLVDTLRDDVLITKAFREVGLSATYLHAAGIYRIQEHEVGEDAPKVEVVVFEEDAVVRKLSKNFTFGLWEQFYVNKNFNSTPSFNSTQIRYEVMNKDVEMWSYVRFSTKLIQERIYMEGFLVNICSLNVFHSYLNYQLCDSFNENIAFPKDSKKPEMRPSYVRLIMSIIPFHIQKKWG